MSLNIEETSISQLSNRTYASVRQYFEGQKDGHVDLSKIRAYWSEMQGEREKERKLMSKMVQVLRKSIASSDVSHRMDKLFDYLSEQLDVLKTYNQKQVRYFE